MYKNIRVYLLPCITAFFLNACNNNIGGDVNSPNKSVLQSIKSVFNSSPDMNIKWSFDNSLDSAGLHTELQDLGWHLMTLTVSHVGTATQPINVQGLTGIIYPQPMQDYGQQIEIKDINCQNAVFANVGDSCSAYFRLKYDTTKAASKIQFPVQIKINNPQLPQFTNFVSYINPNISMSNHRLVLPVEAQYYSGSITASNKLNHQIFLIQNPSNIPFNITQLSASTNPYLTLIHRSNNSDTDPYYGANPECSISDNTTLKQISTLSNLNDYCILVYEASMYNTSANTQQTTIAFKTSSNFYMPLDNQQFNLSASYKVGVPIPDQPIYTLSANLQEPYALNNFNINYSISTTQINTGIYYQSTPSQLVVDEVIGTSFQGLPIITLNNDNSTQNTVISSVIPRTPDHFVVGYARHSGNQSTSGNGDPSWVADSYIDATLDPTKALTQNGQIKVFINGQLHGLNACWYTFNTNALIPMSAPVEDINIKAQPIQLYHYAPGGSCGGGATMDLNVYFYPNNCDYYGNCTANFSFNSHINANGRDAYGENDLNFAYTKPTIYNKLNLSPALNQVPKAIFYGGQRLILGIGDSSSEVQNNLTYAGGSSFSFSTNYNNGLSSPYMMYNIILGQNQYFQNGNIQFTRSSGYDLSQFTASIGQ